MEILDKRELENMKLFYEYIGLETCPTSFAIGTGALSFIDQNKVLRCNYFVNDTSELKYAHILTVNCEGRYKYASKLDKFFPAIRVALYENEINENYIYDEMPINKDISVLEYGYFPKSRINYARTKTDTNVTIKLPVSRYEYNEPEYKDFTVYKDEVGDFYYVIYQVFSMVRIENKDFMPGEVGLFKIEPIRFWRDKNSKILISQDAILGGVQYKISDGEPYQYNDYNESNLCEAVNVIENDIEILDKLMTKEKVKRR